MQITFIGATHEVTGSCTLLEVGGKNILVDCGMEQGADIFENIEIPPISTIPASCRFWSQTDTEDPSIQRRPHASSAT